MLGSGWYHFNNTWYSHVPVRSLTDDRLLNVKLLSYSIFGAITLCVFVFALAQRLLSSLLPAGSFDGQCVCVVYVSFFLRLATVRWWDQPLGLTTVWTAMHSTLPQSIMGARSTTVWLAMLSTHLAHFSCRSHHTASSDPSKTMTQSSSPNLVRQVAKPGSIMAQHWPGKSTLYR